MAKATKGGLGRGLNSLLSASAEEVIPIEDVPVRTREVVEFEEEAKPQRIEKPTPAKAPISQGTVLEREKAAPIPVTFVEKPSPAVQGTPAEEPAKETPFIEDDHIVIKEVVERRSDEVPLDAIQPNPDQPRTVFKQEEIDELAASIEKDGLLQPILVRPVGKKYQIIAGERRWKACKTLGMKTVPVRIREADDDMALELALVENLQRSDLNPIEEAYGYRRLMERKKLTQSDVALVLSKGRSSIANALRLLELPEDAQQLLFEEKITAGHARAILAIPTKAGRQNLTERLVKEKLSVREAETLARLLSNIPREGEAVQREPIPQSFKSIARALRESLQTNVRVKNSKGKNKIEIEFKDEDELEHLYALLSRAEESDAETEAEDEAVAEAEAV